MRKLHRLAFLVVPAMVIACSSLLGDFTVGGGDAGDAQSGNDVTTDAAGDGPVFQTLACDEVNNGRMPVTTGTALHASAVRMITMADGRIRIVLADYPPSEGGPSGAIIQTYTFDPHDTSAGFKPAPLATTSSHVFSFARYGGPKPGFAALYEQYDSSVVTNVVFATRFPDDATSWTTPVQLFKLQPGSVNDENATFIVTDPPNDGYYVAYSSTSGNTQTVLAGDVHPGGVLTTIATFAPTAQQDRGLYSFADPGIAQHGPQTFIMMAASPNGPPPPGLPSVMLVPGQPNVPIQPPSNLNWFPVALTNAVDPLKANAAFLVADLSTSTGSYRIGQFPFASLGTVDPTTLPATVPPVGDGGSTSLKDLFLNAGSVHWEIAGTGEQLLMTSPPADPILQKLYPGINFGWWDGPSGTIRNYRSGDNAFLLDRPNILAGDATFQTIVSSIAQIYLAYLDSPSPPSSQGQLTASDLWITSIGCQKGP